LLWKIEKTVYEELASYKLDLEDDVELKIDASNFVQRSKISVLTYTLRESLDECLNDPKKTTSDHVSAAQTLLKLGKYRETAIKVLIAAANLKPIKPAKEKAPTDEETKTIKDNQETKKLALTALTACASEIAKFDSANSSENFSDGAQSFGYDVANCTASTWNQSTQRLESFCPGEGLYYKSSKGEWTKA